MQGPEAINPLSTAPRLSTLLMGSNQMPLSSIQTPQASTDRISDPAWAVPELPQPPARAFLSDQAADPTWAVPDLPVVSNQVTDPAWEVPDLPLPTSRDNYLSPLSFSPSRTKGRVKAIVGGNGVDDDENDDVLLGLSTSDLSKSRPEGAIRKGKLFNGRLGGNRETEKENSKAAAPTTDSVGGNSLTSESAKEAVAASSLNNPVDATGHDSVSPEGEKTPSENVAAATQSAKVIPLPSVDLEDLYINHSSPNTEGVRKPRNQRLQVELMAKSRAELACFEVVSDCDSGQLSPEPAVEPQVINHTDEMKLGESQPRQNRPCSTRGSSPALKQVYESQVPTHEVFTRNVVNPDYGFSDEDESVLPKARFKRTKATENPNTSSEKTNGKGHSEPVVSKSHREFEDSRSPTQTNPNNAEFSHKRAKESTTPVKSIEPASKRLVEDGPGEAVCVLPSPGADKEVTIPSAEENSTHQSELESHAGQALQKEADSHDNEITPAEDTEESVASAEPEEDEEADSTILGEDSLILGEGSLILGEGSIISHAAPEAPLVGDEGLLLGREPSPTLTISPEVTRKPSVLSSATPQEREPLAQPATNRAEPTGATEVPRSKPSSPSKRRSAHEEAAAVPTRNEEQGPQQQKPSAAPTTPSKKKQRVARPRRAESDRPSPSPSGSRSRRDKASSILSLLSDDEDEDELSLGPEDFTPSGSRRKRPQHISSSIIKDNKNNNKAPSPAISTPHNHTRRVLLQLSGSGSGSTRRPSTTTTTRRGVLLSGVVAATPSKLGRFSSRLGIGAEGGSSPSSRSVTITTPRRSLLPAANEPELVQTPGGTVRKCGEGGFRCDRDFCFECL